MNDYLFSFLVTFGVLVLSRIVWVIACTIDKDRK